MPLSSTRKKKNSMNFCMCAEQCNSLHHAAQLSPRMAPDVVQVVQTVVWLCPTVQTAGCIISFVMPAYLCKMCTHQLLYILTISMSTNRKHTYRGIARIFKRGVSSQSLQEGFAVLFGNSCKFFKSYHIMGCRWLSGHSGLSGLLMRLQELSYGMD